MTDSTGGPTGGPGPDSGTGREAASRADAGRDSFTGTGPDIGAGPDAEPGRDAVTDREPALILHLDPTLGVAGDMLLAALVDAGADRGLIAASIAAVLPGAEVSFADVRRAGLRALAATVTDPPTSPHRRWSDLSRSLTEAPLPPTVARRALATFTLLARAEAHVHGIPEDDVHFHEVGAADSVCDVVGVAAALASLRPAAITAGPIATGSGTVATEHGVLPVPPPAVAQVLADSRLPTLPGPARFESCTPTGAALLAACVDDWTSGPAMQVERVGVGAGTADPSSHANVVRVFVGRPVAPPDTPQPGGAVVLETNVDDLDPRLWPGIQADLLAAGASDAWLTPILMKKGRPAMTLAVLGAPARCDELAAVILRSTTAIGMRVLPVGKIAAEREMVTVTVFGQPIRVKIARWHGRVVNVQPEWEDVASAARTLEIPAKQVLATATAAAADCWEATESPGIPPIP